MQKKTRSLLEELDSMYVERDRRLIIESRADNIIASAIRLVEQIEHEFGVSPGQACVFYKPDQLGVRVLGGGWIRATE